VHVGKNVNMQNITWKQGSAKMRITKGVSVICLFIVLFSSGCLNNEEGNVVIMSMADFLNNYEETRNENLKIFTGVYRSLDEDDILILRDVLNTLIYVDSDNYTLIEFQTSLGNYISIEGDITDIFETKEEVEIKLHVSRVGFFHQVDDSLWFFDLEILEERWDIENNTLIPIPQKAIRHA
jgi:hypothetical protein